MSRLITGRGNTLAIFMVILAIFTIGSSACSSHTNTPAQTHSTAHRLKFVVVTDGQTNDPFWSAVKQGVNKAAAAMGVTATYQTLNAFSVPAMSQLIDAAVAAKPDGLVVSIPDCTGLTPAIKRTQLVGIPVISIDSGNDCASKLGLLNYVGQAGYQAGLESGQKFVAAGAKNVLCINQAVGTPDLDDRCRGVNDALIQAGGKSEVLGVDLNSPNVVQQIQTTLIQDPSIDAIITLNSTSASLAISALQGSGHLSHIMLATFDVSSEIFQAIQQGNMLFALDQKPYWQGYLPIILLARYKKHLNTLATPISTADPGFVTIDNVLQVEQNPTPGTP